MENMATAGSLSFPQYIIMTALLAPLLMDVATGTGASPVMPLSSIFLFPPLPPQSACQQERNKQ